MSATSMTTKIITTLRPWQIAYVRTWRTWNHKFDILPYLINFNKYVYKQTFSASRVRETILRDYAHIKVAFAVKIKLFFTDWFYYNLITQFMVTQNTIQNFRQSSVFEKPGIMSENLKTFTSSNDPAVQ